MSVSQVASGGVKGAMSGIFGILVKYVVPLGMTFVGYSMGGAINVGYLIDENVGKNEMIAAYWKEGYGRLLGAAIFLSIGVTLIMADGSGFGGVIKGAIGGILTGAGLFQLQEGASSLGVA
ncbi:hypothetical protein [Candidatus Magnetobacterium casense]|uniref:Uncharacterized protein n=1 Tax=Candidatus Magnetobacterium casense TaxID=1455061 RepID=A0ABS6S4T5_9BACT|nr:hypothetical protein [Candidatus Magnetobacterium casensis]MBV6343404.1 hypothetical protein [Candidatus Magnetobacterium casensis]